MPYLDYTTAVDEQKPSNSIFFIAEGVKYIGSYADSKWSFSSGYLVIVSQTNQ